MHQDELEHQQALTQESRDELDRSRKDKDKEEASLQSVAKDKEQIKVSSLLLNIGFKRKFESSSYLR